MSMPQVRDDLDAVESRVFGQGSGDHFHGVGKGFPADGFGAGAAVRLVAEGVGDGDFGRAPAGDEGFLFNEAADHAQSVVEASLGFVEDKSVGAAADDRDGLSGTLVRDACDFDDTRAGGLGFFDELGGTQLVFCERIDVCYWFAAGALRYCQFPVLKRLGGEGLLCI